MAEYYVTKRRMYELRQTRFLNYNNHPHDVCAVARSVEEMKEMLASVNWQGTVDYSSVEGETNELQQELPPSL